MTSIGPYLEDRSTKAEQNAFDDELDELGHAFVRFLAASVIAAALDSAQPSVTAPAPRLV